MKPQKVPAKRNFERPTYVKQLRRFLGMVNFYGICLQETAQLQAPLSDLLHRYIKGNMEIAWASETIECFEKLNEGIIQATLLAHPKQNTFPALFCDKQQKVSDRRELLGFYWNKNLSQRNPDTEHLIASFWLFKPQWNFSTHAGSVNIHHLETRSRLYSLQTRNWIKFRHISNDT